MKYAYMGQRLQQGNQAKNSKSHRSTGRIQQDMDEQRHSKTSIDGIIENVGLQCVASKVKLEALVDGTPFGGRDH